MPYDSKNNPNNDTLPEQNTFGRTSQLEVGDKVWKLFGDMRHSFTHGTVERTQGMSGKVYVRWQSGVAYQEDPLYLLKREDMPYIASVREAVNKKAVREFISKKVVGQGSTTKTVKESGHSVKCSCPVCKSETKKVGKTLVCTKEGCFFVKQK